MNVHALRTPASVVAAILAMGGGAPAFAGPAQVEALAGDPGSARNALFVIDEIDVFTNPALLHDHRNKVLLSLAVGSSYGLVEGGAGGLGGLSGLGVSVDPFGGGIIGNDTVSFGIFLNRSPGLFEGDAALDNLVGEATEGGPGGSFVYTGGSSTPLFPAVDLALAADLGPVQLGIGGFVAVGRRQSNEEMRVGEGEFATSTTTQESSRVMVTGGLVVPGALQPEVWFRGGIATGYDDDWSRGPEYPERPSLIDDTRGIADTGTFGGGFRLNIDAGNRVLLLPGISFGYAHGTAFHIDRVQDLPEEKYEWTFDSLSGAVGVGIDYAPTDRFRVIGTAELEFDWVGMSVFNGEPGAPLTVDTSDVTLRAPVLSIGAEGQPIGPLVIRGAIRAGLLGSATSQSSSSEDASGLLAAAADTSNLGSPSLSASGGLGLRFPQVRVDAVAGGSLIASDSGPGFFSRLDVTFLIPRRAPVDETEPTQPWND